MASGTPASTDAILVADHILVRYETAEGPITAVDDMSFTVRPGEFLPVIGPSGCGKSTLFNVIGGLLSHHQGTVSVAGEIISGPHKSIGMVFQEESTFPWRTVIDNVAFPLELVGMERGKRAERARYFINMVGLAGFENRYPGELSGGMRQRVSLARTLASEPKILLMGEPFAALDEQTRLLLGDKVLQIQQELKQTTLLITHNITEAVQMSDRILVMTYRPGRMKRIVDIDLPRPRTSEIVSSEAFGRYVAQIWSDLREEASRGMAEAESNALHHDSETWVAALASAPFVLMYPLFMVIFGRNAWTIIMMGFVSALPPVILKTIEGLSGTRKVLVNVGRSFNLTGTQQFWKILFPAALPTFFVGIRLGLIFALINIVGTEFLINFGGLGQLIEDLAERYDLAGTYAAICFVILVSILFFMTLEKIERWLRPVD